MKKILFYLPSSSIIFLFFFIFSGCTTNRAPLSNTNDNSTTDTLKLSSSESKYVFVFTSNRMNELEPCGCSIRNIGGAAREYNLLQSLKKTYHAEPIELASGALFTPRENEEEQKNIPSDQKKDIFSFKSSYLIEAMNTLGLKAQQLSSKDLFYGEDFLKTHMKEAHFPFISTNIYSKKDNKPFAKTYATILLGSSFKTVIFSLTPPHSEVPSSQFLVQTTYVELLNQAYKESQGGDLNILLSDLPKEDLEKIKKSCPYIHIFHGSDKEEKNINTFDIWNAHQFFVNSISGGRGAEVFVFSLPPQNMPLPQKSTHLVGGLDMERAEHTEFFFKEDYNNQVASIKNIKEELKKLEAQKISGKPYTKSVKEDIDYYTKVLTSYTYPEETFSPYSIMATHISKDISRSYETPNNPLHQLISLLKKKIKARMIANDSKAH